MRRVKHALAVSRLTRRRGFTRCSRGAASRFHVAQNIVRSPIANGVCDSLRLAIFFPALSRAAPRPVTTKRTLDHSERCHRFAVTLRFSSLLSHSFSSPLLFFWCYLTATTVTLQKVRERSLCEDISDLFTRNENVAIYKLILGCI